MQPVEIRISIGADGSVDVTREPSRGFDPPATPTAGVPGMFDVPYGSTFGPQPFQLRGDRGLFTRIAKRMIARELQETRGMTRADAEAEAERIGAGGFQGLLTWLLENLPAILEILLKLFGGI